MGSRAPFSEAFGTRFSITVDTEEEFEWDRDLSREAFTVTTAPAIEAGQKFFTAANVKPLYYIDYPVLADKRAAAMFAAFVEADVADAGVHMHPWVTPPFDEQLSRPNSYAGNLPPQIEHAKLRKLCAMMVRAVGVRPLAYRAGRYGIGPNTRAILVKEGFICDSSVRSLFDYRSDGGPDFRCESIFPSHSGRDGRILELPLTAVYVGAARRLGRSLYPSVGHNPVMASALSRTGLIKRVPFTPEGVPAPLACDAIDVALDLGLKLLTFSFHSPSLAIGHTPYVRNPSDLVRFYRWFDVVLNHLAKRGVTSAGLRDILDGAGVRVPEQTQACQSFHSSAIAPVAANGGP